MPTPRRILVIRPDRIGDVVLATPLIRALRVSFPDAYLGALVRPYAADVLAGSPHLDTIVTDDPAADSFPRAVSSLRTHRFDTALHLLPSRRHTWMTFFAGIRTRIAVGWRPYHALTFMRMVSRRNYIPLRHEADYCLDLGRAIGAHDDGLRVEVFVSDASREAASKRLASLSGLRKVAIVPASGGSSPNWTVDTYARLAALLLERPDTGVVVLASGTGIDTEPFRRLDSVRTLIVGDTTLQEGIGLIATCDVLVSSSTGPMHIAAGVGTPTVSLFCPLPACSPELWGPQGERCEVIMPPEGYCQGSCPGDPKVCTFEGGITPEMVAAKLGA